ncbi:MAG: type I glyceraldehyde-3-phosphate dehydrogenase [Patescibacteria group bacterium]
MTKIAINGFGRIGRPAFKVALEKKDLEVVAINDLVETKTLAHLLKYDSTYGRYNKNIEAHKKSIFVEDKEILCFAETEPERLPWKDLDVDIVIESTGHFTKFEEAKKHLIAGAKKVIISAPSKSEETPTYVLGVNEDKYNPEKEDIIANSSCTTNCLAPVVKVLNDYFGVNQGLLTTCHSYTNDQRILDLPHRDLRRARAAAINIIPTTTGAARDVAKTIPELKGVLDGISLRVPTPTVSIVDFVAVLKKKTTVEEINKTFEKEAGGKLKGILDISYEPLVSMDFKGDSHSAIVDGLSTMIIDDLVKVVAWYDNELGYAHRLIEMVEYVGKKM